MPSHSSWSLKDGNSSSVLFTQFQIEFQIQFQIQFQQTTIWNLISANCNRQTAICIWQFAKYNLRTTIYKLQIVICHVLSLICSERGWVSSHHLLSLEGVHFQSAFCSLLEFKFESETQCGIESETESGTQYQIYVDSRSKNPISIAYCSLHIAVCIL